MTSNAPGEGDRPDDGMIPGTSEGALRGRRGARPADEVPDPPPEVSGADPQPEVSGADPQPEVSVVIPVYNEEECLPHLIRAMDAFLSGFQRSAEVILVDDGSRDRSFEVIADALRSRPAYRCVKLRANRGQTPAMAAGLRDARGRYIVFMDGDLQNDPEDIPALLDEIERGYDLVSGWRRERRDRALSRKLPSKIANWIIGRVTGVRVHDYGCSLKAYRASVVRPLRLYSDMHRFLPALCQQTGARVTEMVVHHKPRLLGQSKYGLNRIFKVIADLIVIKLILSGHDRPIHFFGYPSLVFLTVGMASGWLWAVNRASGWQEGAVILPTITLLSVCAALYFLFLGLLADMIVRVGRKDPAEAALGVLHGDRDHDRDR